MMKLFERRYDPESAKFATQLRISFYVIFITASVIAVICYNGGVSDAKEIYNTLLPIFAGVVGFWIGNAKYAQDQQTQMNKMIAPDTPPITTEEQK